MSLFVKWAVKQLSQHPRNFWWGCKTTLVSRALVGIAIIHEIGNMYLHSYGWQNFEIQRPKKHNPIIPNLRSRCAYSLYTFFLLFGDLRMRQWSLQLSPIVFFSKLPSTVGWDSIPYAQQFDGRLGEHPTCRLERWGGHAWERPGWWASKATEWTSGNLACEQCEQIIVVVVVVMGQYICTCLTGLFIWATVKISEDQFSREGLKMTSDMHETL